MKSAHLSQRRRRCDIQGLPIGRESSALLAASGAGGTRGFALARYNSNGSLETSFDGDGRLSTGFGGVDDPPEESL